jgi:hypothetical protein
MLPSMLLAVIAAGCGGTDPTAPRDVRPIEAQELPGAPQVDQDEAAPSRGLPCDAQDGEQARLCGAATDNYKASFNERPEDGDARTWLAIHELELDGTRYLPEPGQPLTGQTLALRSGDGDQVTVRASIESGPGRTIVIRFGPQQGLWGPLLTIEQRPLSPGDVVVVRLLVEDDEGSQLATTDVEYRHDPVIADAPADSLEHLGPGGRWFVAGTATGTNVELGWE